MVLEMKKRSAVSICVDKVERSARLGFHFRRSLIHSWSSVYYFMSVIVSELITNQLVMFYLIPNAYSDL
jgi:hypothetical protein